MTYGQALARARNEADRIDAMTGEAGGGEPVDIAVRAPAEEGPLALEVSALAGTGFDAVSFAVRRGEVIGLVGASTSGRAELAEAIVGLRKPRSGTVRVFAREGVAAVKLPYGDAEAALDAGIGCVPKARQREAQVLGRSLSGGDRQKVVIARALATDPAVLVFIDLTLGVDVKSKDVLLAQIDRAREDGRAVIVSSGEPDDLRSCDRVFAMFRGRIVKAFGAFWADHELIAAIEGGNRNEAWSLRR